MTIKGILHSFVSYTQDARSLTAMQLSIVLVLIFPLLWEQTSAQNFWVAAPNTLRIGSDENIAIAVDGTNKNEMVEILIQDYPGKKKTLFRDTIAVNQVQSTIVNVNIDPNQVSKVFTNQAEKQFVILTVSSGAFRKEAIIPLTGNAGYVFLQTDKPIYTPKERANFRIIQLDEDTKPTKQAFRFQILNPDNAVVRERIYTDIEPSELIFTPKPYEFPSYPIFGLWSAVVQFGHEFSQNTTVKFELKEYVLPTFTVELKVQEVILPEDESITVSVKAMYLYGKPLDGVATFRVSVKGEAPGATLFAIYNPKELNGGECTLNVDTSILKNHHFIKWFPEIKGSHLIVEAEVTDSASGLKEKVKDSRSQFSTSPFSISFKRSLDDFKPGLVSIIEAEVMYVNGQPASGVRTILTGTADNGAPLKIVKDVSESDDNGIVQFEIQTTLNNEKVDVQVRTDHDKYRNNQAVESHTLHKFHSKNSAYIAITRSSTAALRPGDMFREVLYTEPAGISNIHYVISSKGKVVTMGKLTEGNYKIHRIEFQVTESMIPSFRLTAFTVHNEELIADSLKIDTTSECLPNAQVHVEPELPEKAPASNIDIVIKGSKSTLVGLLGIDSGVYAMSRRDLLTQSKIFKVMEQHDFGCGPGGGTDTNTVLGHAGVILMTNTYAPNRDSMVSCEEKIRRRRAILYNKLSEYTGRLHSCCALGMREAVYKRSCVERAERVINLLRDKDDNCSSVFLECCLYKEAELHTDLTIIGKKPVQTTRTSQSATDNDLLLLNEENFDDIPVRSDFREIWIFQNLLIGSDKQIVKSYTLPHSITTWILQAVGVSQEYGICVMPEKTVRSFKNVFLQLHLPYSVIRSEQVEVKATLFNYGENPLTARVYMDGVKDLCTGIQEGEKSNRKMIKVEPLSGQSISFPVLPLKEGVFDIKISALSYEGSDIVMKKLTVVPEGKVSGHDIPIILDPSNQQRRIKRNVETEDYEDYINDARRHQVTAIKLRLPKDYVPGTESCVISALGDPFGPSVQTSLHNPDKLLEGPRGCGEQNMIFFAPTLYAMRYLKSTGQVTPENEEKGYEFMRKGYEHQLTFKKADGSFAAWPQTPPSVWLTAFVVKVFCQGSRLIHINEEDMCTGFKWLMDKQGPDGSFAEDNPIYHKEMVGGVNGQAPLTAYVLLTFEECNCNINNVHIAKAKAVSYLEDQLSNINDPLPVAITAYALALANSEQKGAANAKLLTLGTLDDAQNTLHWSTGSGSGDVETTSYALLTQLYMNDMRRSNAIVNWLNTQRYASGSFHSTQDTVVALHALSEYAIRARSPGVNLVSNITASSDKHFRREMVFNKDNALVLQEVSLSNLGGMLFINTGGHGVGSLSVKLRYNIAQPHEKSCRFEIKIKVTEVRIKNDVEENQIVINPGNKDTVPMFPDDLIRNLKEDLDEPPAAEVYDVDPRNRGGRSISLHNMKHDLVRWTVAEKSSLADPFVNQRMKRANSDENSNLIYNINLCLRYLEGVEAGMTIAAVGIFSGFSPDKSDLENLLTNENHLIERYEASSRGVDFYLRSAPHLEPYCFDFRIRRDFIVGNLQATSIKVYDFYKPEKQCTVFYRPDHSSPMLQKICKDGICQCAEGGCPHKTPFAELLKKYKQMQLRNEIMKLACDSYDYVWKGRVEAPAESKDGFLRVTFRILGVMKAGIEKSEVLVGSVRTLLSKDICTTVAELKAGTIYVIMGKDGDRYMDEDGEVRNRYMLDKITKIKVWSDDEKKDVIQRALVWLQRQLKTGCDS